MNRREIKKKPDSLKNLSRIEKFKIGAAVQIIFKRLSALFDFATIHLREVKKYAMIHLREVSHQYP